jgi:tetratricopeptide (TPR) repeat protein
VTRRRGLLASLRPRDGGAPRRLAACAACALVVGASPARAQAPADSACDPARAPGGPESRHAESCARLREGLDALGRGEYELAVRKLEESLWMSVTFEPGLKEYWLGRALLGLGKTREAAFAFYRALRAEEAAPQPDSALLGTIRLWLGKSYDLLGRREAAREWYRQARDAPGARAEDRAEAERYLADPFADDSTGGAPARQALRRWLLRLLDAQEAYRTAHGRYAARASELGLDLPPDAEVAIGLLDGGAGYIAEGRTADGAHRCTVAWGRGVRARERGVVRCE